MLQIECILFFLINIWIFPRRNLIENLETRCIVCHLLREKEIFLWLNVDFYCGITDFINYNFMENYNYMYEFINTHLIHSY